MANLSPARRLVSSIAIVGLAVALLSVIPAAAANAYSSTSSRGELRTYINKLRVKEGLPAWTTNGMLDTYAQASAQAMADCAGCGSPKYGNLSPSGASVGEDEAFVISQTSAGRIKDAEKYLKSDKSAYASTFTYGAVGYATHGSHGYFFVAGIRPASGNTLFTGVSSAMGVLHGSGHPGSTLSATVPTLSPSPTNPPIYTWVITHDDNITFLPSGTGVSTYTPTIADIGSTLTLTVDESSPGVQDVFFHFSIKVTPNTFTVPKLTVTGKRYVGQTLDATISASPTPDTMHYVWKKDGKTISGETGSTYLVRSGDYGHRIDSQVVISSPGYASVTLKTATKTRIAHTLLIAGTPSISPAAARVGATETAIPGAWTPANTTLSYQWYEGTHKITGATHRTYKVSSSYYGKKLTVHVKGKKTDYTSVTAISAATLAVGHGQFATAVPTITGTDETGSTLTGHIGTWSPAATAYTYQWYVGTTAIAGATHKTYRLIASDAGSYLYFRVFGTRHLYTSYSPMSAGFGAPIND